MQAEVFRTYRGDMADHEYTTTITWTGSTGGGYRSFSREHTASLTRSDNLTMSADAAFRGEVHLTNPEQLVVVAASSCQSSMCAGRNRMLSRPWFSRPMSAATSRTPSRATSTWSPRSRWSRERRLRPGRMDSPGNGRPRLDPGGGGHRPRRRRGVGRCCARPRGRRPCGARCGGLGTVLPPDRDAFLHPRSVTRASGPSTERWP